MRKLHNNTLNSSDWVALILEKYSILSNPNNSLYLEELLKLNLTFCNDHIQHCLNLETFKKIMDNLDWNNKTSILTNSVSYKIINDVQLFVLKKLLNKNIEIFTKQFVDDYILGYFIKHANIGLIKLLQKFNIDIKTVNKIPSIIYCLIHNSKIF